ncbi:hypothetical protein FACS189461_4970 [Spirochaetia bacterium]|nr:hypothetical protein FACS189461_4970 [Spirochaetia bacterium]
MNESESVRKKRTLKLNCGFACLLRDKAGQFDKYEQVNINAGELIISSEVNAKLAAKGAHINSGDTRVMDIPGEILQLDGGAVIDGGVKLEGLFVIVRGDLVVLADGVKNLGEAAGLLVTGTIYYPESAAMTSLVKVSGRKRAYPEGAYVVSGDHDLEKLLAAVPADAKRIWISGRLRTLEKTGLEAARTAGLSFICSSLFTYEGLNSAYGDLFTCPDRTLIPDGYEITGSIKSAELPFHGPNVYVLGDFTMEEKDIPLLDEITSIIVKGKASLPASTVKAFKAKGKADAYFIFEGRYMVINGFEQFSHNRLAPLKDEKITLLVNGTLLFDEDVTAEDVECIASISYNGTVVAPDPAKAVLSSRVGEGNGMMGGSEFIEAMTGLSIQELMGGGHKHKHDEHADDDDDSDSINCGDYFLM